MKRDLIIDFDGTIADSSKRIYELFNKNHKKKGLPFEREKLKWNFEPYITNLKDKMECLSYFGEYEMYKSLEWVDEYAKDALAELSKRYNIIICSKREPGAYDLLLSWLEDNMPCPYETCFISTFNIATPSFTSITGASCANALSSSRVRSPRSVITSSTRASITS